MLIYPDPEIPNHFKPFESNAIYSCDAALPEFAWSRVIRMNYVKDRGFLVFHGESRIDFRNANGDKVTDEIAAVILNDTLPERCAIVHYFGDMSVACIITNVDPGVFQRLNSSQKLQYYDFS